MKVSYEIENNWIVILLSSFTVKTLECEKLAAKPMSITVLGALWLKCVGVSGAIISIAEPTAQLLRILPLALLLPGFQLECFALKSPKRKVLLCARIASSSVTLMEPCGCLDTRHSDFGVT
ncbi:hypothetical protein TNCV_3160111 [Trichonephila clavipes]|nr:hypothetical protein TNCV_3160111 [Trichonephila clavipes]